jgi:hypothetical protein
LEELIKINIEGKARRDNLIIFFPVIKGPPKIGWNIMITDVDKINIKTSEKTIFFFFFLNKR